MIIYRGPSLIDGLPIVAIALAPATNKAANAKTGSMVQTYILADNGQKPGDAIRSGADVSICGDCVHRGDGAGKGRTCYVQMTGPTSVWGKLQRGGYPVATTADITAMGRGRMVRLGTYGDPAAVPTDVWTALLVQSAGHTGYTHQWREAFAQPLRHICMASADTQLDAAQARAAGWRTFRVNTDGYAMRGADGREIVCPASKEAGQRVQCADCGLCAGADKAKPSITIQLHGGFAVHANSNRLADRIIARQAA